MFLRFTHECSTPINHLIVIPAQAGIQFRMRRFAATFSWIPACAGMTDKRAFGRNA
jgi:hypothetical protein